ncbi:MAG TPA: 3-oxoacyl-ACP synthase [Chloroflexi bacterium]|nr:3-oxoacyl-ACP synthase [Chloroflexota bacterium]
MLDTVFREDIDRLVPQATGTRTRRAKLAAVGCYLPEKVRSSVEIESMVADASDGYVPAQGIVEAMTGIRSRRVASDDQQCSDLAAHAARNALRSADVSIGDVDLLIFASAGQDLMEPATSVITASKLGLRCPAFDVKNACNSFLNGIDVADALIASGRYETALVVTGEIPSRCIKWRVTDREDFRLCFAGYTFGDAAGAVLLTACEEGRGFMHGEFQTEPQHWDIGTLAGGGSMHPRGDEHTYFRGDGARLGDAFAGLGTTVLDRALATMETDLEAWDVVLVHQVTVPMHLAFLRATGIRSQKTVQLVDELGNCASASMALQLHRAVQTGRAEAGARVLWVGLAGGISVGVMGLQL